MRLHRTTLAWGGTLVVLAIVVIVMLSVAGQTTQLSPREVDGAFAVEMAGHHRMAIEMSTVALPLITDRRVGRFAERMIIDQRAEAADIQAAHQRIFGAPISRAGMSHGGLGLSAEEVGMDIDLEALIQSKPFNRAYIDAMIRHHRGAIRMATIVLERGEDPGLADIARSIKRVQAREIARLESLRGDVGG